MDKVGRQNAAAIETTSAMGRAPETQASLWLSMVGPSPAIMSPVQDALGRTMRELPLDHAGMIPVMSRAIGHETPEHRAASDMADKVVIGANAVGATGRRNAAGDAAAIEGFSYLQHLWAQGYLSQEQTDESQPHIATVGMASVIGATPQGSIEGAVEERTGTPKGGQAGGVAHPRDADPQTPGMGQINQAEESSSVTTDADTPIRSVSVEWLKRDGLILNRQGQVQIWVRDYRLDEHGQALLVDNLLAEARAGGQRVVSIILNGRVIWQDQPR